VHHACASDNEKDLWDRTLIEFIEILRSGALLVVTRTKRRTIFKRFSRGLCWSVT